MKYILILLHKAGVFNYHCMMHGTTKLKKKKKIGVFNFMRSFLHYVLDAILAQADDSLQCVVARYLRTAGLDLQQICLELLVVTQCTQLSCIHC